MKPYLVDVPVKINIWTRPECQRKQFEVIKQARPRKAMNIQSSLSQWTLLEVKVQQCCIRKKA